MKYAENGRVKINGAMGHALEWLRWSAQVVLIPALIALSAWVVRVEKFHVSMTEFAQAGPRFTAGTSGLTTADDLRRQLLLDMHELMEDHAEVHRSLPPQDYRDIQDERYASLDDRLKAIMATQRDILAELRRR